MSKDKMKVIAELLATNLEMLTQEIEAITGNKVTIGITIHNLPVKFFSEKAVKQTIQAQHILTEFISDDILCFSSKTESEVKNG